MFDPKTRLLVIDDMMTMRKLVAKICKELGFTDVQEASDGVKAWDIITTTNPPIGLIISDWNTPPAILDLDRSFVEFSPNARWVALPRVGAMSIMDLRTRKRHAESGRCHPHLGHRIETRIAFLHRRASGRVRAG